MPRIQEITLYQFDELSEQAKERAREWFRSCRDSNDFDYVIEDAVRMGEILGISFRTHPVKLMGGGTRQDPSISWQVGYMQSDGAWIEGSYGYAKGAHKAIRKEAPQDTTLHELADRLLALEREYGYQLTASFRDDDRRPLELDLDHPTKEISAETYKAFRAIIRDYEQWIYNQLRTEDEYQSADEQVDESIRANEYEFTAEGAIS